MKRRRNNYVLGLSLLDVMACGLGAVLLLFLIIKHNTGTLAAQEAKVNVASQVATLEALQAQKEDFLSEIELYSKMQEIQNEAKSELQKERTAKKKILEQLQKEIDKETKKKASLEKQVAAQQPKQTTSVVEDIQRSEEQYLIGMKVEGRKIVILVDHSASMTDNKLIDVIVRKERSNAHKRNGPKWQRTIRTAKWLLNRLPNNSEVAVVTFNESAKILNHGKWTSSRDASGIQKLFDEIGELIPSGATNLEAGLDAVSKRLPQTTNIYVITDGLPTKGKGSIKLFQGCQFVKNTISGECRLKLFNSAAANFLSGKRRVVNVILLPLEGDPDAAHAYWSFAALTGGRMLAPATGWP